MIRLSIPVNERTKNLIGEILRELFFDQSQGFGCYQTFQLLPGVVELPNNEETYTDIYDNEEKVIWHNAMLVTNTDTIEMSYAWDGDGTLIFKFANYVLSNSDCKKDYTWELTGDE